VRFHTVGFITLPDEQVATRFAELAMIELSSSHKRTLPHIIALPIYLLITAVALDRMFLHFDAALPGDGKHRDYAIFRWDIGAVHNWIALDPLTGA
jgi:hypothetical protein